jgi:divalent metal cation (Fe/Co/Zn/Cd) transporter
VLELVDGEELLDVRNVRGVKSGGQTHLDLTISVPPGMSVRDSHAVEQRVREAVMKARRDVREVKVHVHGEEDAEREARVADSGVGEGGRAGNGRKGDGPRSDFGAEGC